MKKSYFLLFLLSSFIGLAQPAGYYDTATGNGYTLKTQLFNIIGPHTKIAYSPGLWNLYPSSDAKPDGKVWDIYSSCIFTFGTVATGGNQDNGTGGNLPCERFNREHTFPKSWFGGVAGTEMYSDAFHVMPTDKKINGLRGNLAYGIVGTNTIPASYSTTCKVGNNIAANGPNITVFEPSDEYKGDVARNYFYMATCYQNVISSWQTIDPSGDAFLDGTNTKVYEQWALDMLYQWHLSDPVSAKEIARNNAVYAVQGNRNPFIDHPEWVQRIWGANLSTDSFDMLASVNIYPNPTNDHRINIETLTELDEIQLISINGQIMQQVSHPKANQNVYTLENLPQGFYLLKLNSDNHTIVKKIVIN